MSRANGGARGRRSRWGAPPPKNSQFHGFAAMNPPEVFAPPRLIAMPPVSFFNPRVPHTRHVPPPAPEFEVNSLNERRPLPPHPATTSSSSLEGCNLTVKLNPNSTREVSIPAHPSQQQPQVSTIPKPPQPPASTVTVVRTCMNAVAPRATVKAEEGSKESPILINDEESAPPSRHVCPNTNNRVSVDVKSELNGEVPLRVIKSEYCSCCGTPKRLTVMLKCHKDEPVVQDGLPGTAEDPIVVDDDNSTSRDSEVQNPAVQGVMESPASPAPSDNRLGAFPTHPVRIPLTPIHCLSPEPVPQIPTEAQQSNTPSMEVSQEMTKIAKDPKNSAPSDDGMLPDSEDEPYITDSDSGSEQPRHSNSSSPFYFAAPATTRKQTPEPSNIKIVNLELLAMILKRRFVDTNLELPKNCINATLTADEPFDEVLRALKVDQATFSITVKRRSASSSGSPPPESEPMPAEPPVTSSRKDRRAFLKRKPKKFPRKVAKKKIFKKTPKSRAKPPSKSPPRTESLSRTSSLTSEALLSGQASPIKPAKCPEPSGSPQLNEEEENSESRPLSPTSEMRALALATLQRRVAVIPASPVPEVSFTATEDIPLPPPPPEPEMEAMPPPPPPPELEEVVPTVVSQGGDHERDNSAVEDMDVVDDRSDAPTPPVMPAEIAPPNGKSTTTVFHSNVFRTEGNNIKIIANPPMPPRNKAVTAEELRLQLAIKEVTKRRLMTGTIHQDQLPPGCPRPQQALGRSFPVKNRKVIEEYVDSDNNQENCYKSKSVSLRKVASESLVAEKGRTEATFLPPFAKKRRLELMQAGFQPPPKRFGNQSMRMINGERVYSDSNSCHEFLKGTCSRGIFCRYSHGDVVPEDKKICSRMLRGQCRGDRGCRLNHELPAHQLPACDFYLRYSCSQKNCCFLHVKHTDDTPPCEAFNAGTCKDGNECAKPHRYIYRTVKLRGEFPE